MKANKERINYVIDRELCGKCVNYRIIVQGKTKVELEKSARQLLEIWINYAQNILKQKHPFEFKEVSLKEFMKK